MNHTSKKSPAHLLYAAVSLSLCLLLPLLTGQIPQIGGGSAFGHEHPAHYPGKAGGDHGVVHAGEIPGGGFESLFGCFDYQNTLLSGGHSHWMKAVLSVLL